MSHPGQLLLEEMVRSDLNAVAFSPDGAHFLSASRTGLELRDAASGALARALCADPAGSGKWETSTTIAFAPDGARALSIKESTLCFWDIAKGEILHTVKDDDFIFIAAAVFTPDGRSVLSASRERSNREGRALKLWDVETGRLVRSLEIAAGRRRLGGVVAGRRIRAWRATRRNVVFARNARQLRTFRHGRCAGIARDGDRATRSAYLESHIRPFTAVAFSRDGSRFAAASYQRCGNSLLHLWDAQTGRQLRTHSGAWHACDLGRAVGERRPAAGGRRTDRHRKIAANSGMPPSGELRRAFAEPERLGGSYWVYAAALCAGCRGASRRLPAMSGRSSFGMWRRAGSPAHLPGGFRLGLHSRPTEPRLLSGAWDAPRRPAQAVGRGERHLAAVVPAGKRAPAINAVALSANGSRALAGSQDGAVTLWDAASEAPPRRLEGHADEVYAVAFSPDGLRALSGSLDGTIKNLGRGGPASCSRALAGHCAAVNAAVYSPDGTRVLSASNNSTVRMWDAQSGELLATFIAGEELWLTLDAGRFLRGLARRCRSHQRGSRARGPPGCSRP